MKERVTWKGTQLRTDFIKTADVVTLQGKTYKDQKPNTLSTKLLTKKRNHPNGTRFQLMYILRHF